MRASLSLLFSFLPSFLLQVFVDTESHEMRDMSMRKGAADDYDYDGDDDDVDSPDGGDGDKGNGPGEGGGGGGGGRRDGQEPREDKDPPRL